MRQWQISEAVGDALEGVRLDEAEQVARHPAHLDLLGALGDAVPAVVPVDVLERAVPRVAQAAVHLHGAVGGLAAQPVGHVVAHGNLVGLGERPVGVHAPRGLVDERPQHLALRLQLDQRELDRLVARERLAERLLRALAYSTERSMQNCAAPRLEAAWRMRYSLKKCWTICRPRPSVPRMALSGTRTSVNETCAW